MKNIKNLEIISISTRNGNLYALLSYQDISTIGEGEDINNGYNTIEIPINIREIQTSIRGNMLVDQSVKDYVRSQNVMV
jgi:hypothetical protein